MFLIPYVMIWSVFAVLSLCQPVWSASRVTQPYMVVSANGSAQVQCFVHPSPSYQLPEPEMIRVSLLKGLHSTQAICWSMLNLTEPTATDAKKEGQVQCSVQMGEGAVELTVTGLKASDTDLYRCQIEVMFPPPYFKLKGNGTLVHVLESSDCPAVGAQRQTAHQADEDKDDESDERTEPLSFPVVVLVILVIFALLFIIYLQALQCKEMRREIVRPVPAVHHKGDAAFSC
ncbi:cytotoxic T-lymphocyte protein 4 isoform X1 [Xyrichtys novacula]|uniref:Cytotoxic T-lymphocyte protein 4 isoform X1 n=1 Tax=Xyrichtys novacula TaxID=13765 RepID=A0AAV1H2I8_XYRNO|nr:cytotoxic T-lymphocyte protein 4 isoform X1 [Xyrichtys novacula]